MRWLSWLLLLITLLTPLPANAAPPRATRGDKVVYVTGGDLWWRPADAGPARRLTRGGGYSAPRWSPSGRWILAHKGDDVRVIPATGGPELALPLGHSLPASAAWAPHRDEIAYLGPEGQIALFPPDRPGDHRIVLPADTEGRSGPVWSPDGRELAYVAGRGAPPDRGYTGIWAVSVADGKPRELHADRNLPTPCLDPVAWAEPGLILFQESPICSSSIRADGVALRAVPARGGPPVTLVDDMLTYPPFLAVRGNQLAVVAGGGRPVWFNKRLEVLHLPGGERRPVSGPGQIALSPDWAPDGGRLVFTAAPAAPDTWGGEAGRKALYQRRLWTANADGSGRRQVTHGQGFRDEAPRWLARGDGLLFVRIDQAGNMTLRAASPGGATRVLANLGRDREWFGFYGWTDYSTLFDVWRPQPPGPGSAVSYRTLTPAGNTVDSAPLPDEPDPSGALYARWSPDGRQFVYGKQGDLWLFDSAGNQSRNLTATPDRWELMPTWSPDGKQIAFVSRPLEPGEGRIWHSMHGCSCGSPTLVRPDGSGYRILTPGEAVNTPSWSPDGSELAFDDRGQIRLYHLATGRVTTFTAAQVLPRARFIGAPAYSPVRNQLAFFFSESDQAPTRKQVLSGTAPRPAQGYALLDRRTRQVRVLHTYRAPFSPRPPALWAADGRRLALNLTCQLSLCDPVGLQVIHLENARVDVVSPQAYQAAWEPGGRRLAFIDNNDRRQVQVVTFTNGGWHGQTLRHDQLVEGITWRPAPGSPPEAAPLVAQVREQWPEIPADGPLARRIAELAARLRTNAGPNARRLPPASSRRGVLPGDNAVAGGGLTPVSPCGGHYPPCSKARGRVIHELLPGFQGELPGKSS